MANFFPLHLYYQRCYWCWNECLWKEKKKRKKSMQLVYHWTQHWNFLCCSSECSTYDRAVTRFSEFQSIHNLWFYCRFQSCSRTTQKALVFAEHCSEIQEKRVQNFHIPSETLLLLLLLLMSNFAVSVSCNFATVADKSILYHNYNWWFIMFSNLE